jgi:hypothetical protein
LKATWLKLLIVAVVGGTVWWLLRPPHAGDSVGADTGVAAPSLPDAPVRSPLLAALHQHRISSHLHPRDRALLVWERPNNDPRARREDYLTAIEASGATAAPWTRSAAAVVAMWKDVAAPEQDAHFSPVRCYEAGCFTVARFSSDGYQDQATRAILSRHKRGGWIGGMVRTPPDPTPGGVVVAWVLLPPRQDRVAQSLSLEKGQDHGRQ